MRSGGAITPLDTIGSRCSVPTDPPDAHLSPREAAMWRALALSVFLALTCSVPSYAEHPICTQLGTQDQVAVAPGDSSAVIVWRDNRYDPANPFDIFASRINYFMRSLWSPFGDGADERSAAASQTE